jgi:hypothetical protein
VAVSTISADPSVFQIVALVLALAFILVRLVSIARKKFLTDAAPTAT